MAKTKYKGVGIDKRGRIYIKFKGKFKRTDINGDPFVSEEQARDIRRDLLMILAAEEKHNQEKFHPNPALKLTFRSAVELFLKRYEENVSETTFADISRSIRLHIRDKMPSGIKIGEITQKHLDKWRIYMKSLPALADFKNRMLAYMIRIFEYIDEFHDITIKYAKRLSKFRDDYPTPMRKKSILRLPDLWKLLEKLQSPMLKCYFLLNYFLGIRIGEMRALHIYSYVKEERALYTGPKVSSKTGSGKVKEFPAKTRKSYRTIPLPEFLEKALEDYLANHHPAAQDENSYIFYSTGNGPKEPVSERHLRDNLNRALSSAKISHMELREFRHSFASYASFLNQGDLNGIYQIMGHSAKWITLEHYDQNSKLQMRNVMNKINRIISKNSSRLPDFSK